MSIPVLSPHRPTRRRAARGPGPAWARAGAAWGLLAALAGPGAASADEPARVLRVALVQEPPGLDPARVSDIYSAEVLGHICEPLLRFAYLARPLKLVPLTAAALPEVSDDHRQFILRLRPGIRFSEDPAFGGPARELSAQDYVYAIQRNFDPRLKSPHRSTLAALGILGLDALFERAQASGQGVPADASVPGLQALDRHTLRIRTERPQPRLPEVLAAGNGTCAVPREVVEARGGDLSDHPVGTGPFLLQQWHRGSRMTLVRNPGFREVRYAETPPADAPAAQASAARLKGRRLPMLDRVELQFIAEDQPRWLSFLRADLDYSGVPYPLAPLALPGQQVAPHLARRGIEARITLRPDVVYTYFNMDDPMVGGYSPAQVALRRAIALGYDNAEEVRLLRRGLALPAQGIVPPLTEGYDASLRSEMSAHDPARARALLDLYGFVDRDGDGWRERPDGAPLLLRYASSQTLREFNEFWQRHMQRIGVRIEFIAGQWPEQQKAARAGQLMMWFLSYNANQPDGGAFLRMAYGGAKGSENYARFDLPAYNALYERIEQAVDGPERRAWMAEASRLLLAYLPIKAHVHRMGASLVHPWVDGFHPNPFVLSTWTYLDVDPARSPASSAAHPDARAAH